MARLTNEQIRKMSLEEADMYTDEHPNEAWRFAKAYGKSTIKHAKRRKMLGSKK